MLVCRAAAEAFGALLLAKAVSVSGLVARPAPLAAVDDLAAVLTGPCDRGSWRAKRASRVGRGAGTAARLAGEECRWRGKSGGVGEQQCGVLCVWCDLPCPGERGRGELGEQPA